MEQSLYSESLASSPDVVHLASAASAAIVHRVSLDLDEDLSSAIQTCLHCEYSVRTSSGRCNNRTHHLARDSALRAPVVAFVDSAHPVAHHPPG